MTRATRRRTGFTLIELLVVIAILGVLAAISVGGLFRIRTSQQISASEQLMRNVTTTLNRQYSAVIDQAAEDSRKKAIPDAVLDLAGGDADRAKSLWTYLRLKNEFPQSFDEAKADVTVNFAGTPQASKYTSAVTLLKAKATFKTLPAGALSADGSAAMLYLIVTEKGNRGEVFDEGSSGVSVTEITVGGANYKAFKDAFGKPVGFARWATNNEINAAPYAKTGVTSRDPCDPLGKLTTGWNAQLQTAARNALGLGSFGNTNWVMTAVGQGTNGAWDGFTPAAGLTTINEATDNILSYRLRREGQRGD